MEKARHHRTPASHVGTVSQRDQALGKSPVLEVRQSGHKQKNKPGGSWGQEEGEDQSGRGRVCLGECAVLCVRLCT